MMRFALVLALLTAPAAQATPIAEIICAPSPQMTQRLTGYGHARHASGVRGPEQVMEVWTDSRGDWTMVVRYATGTSCIVAMGEAWDDARPAKDPA